MKKSYRIRKLPCNHNANPKRVKELRTGMKQSLARPQRTFNGSQAASFERASVVRQLAGEYAVQAMEPHNYYRGNVQLVGDEFSGESREYEPLRALR